VSKLLLYEEWLTRVEYRLSEGGWWHLPTSVRDRAWLRLKSFSTFRRARHTSNTN